MSEHLRLDLAGPVATLTIDGPAKRNAKVEAEETVRVLVIRGTDHFSAGADIGEFASLRGDADGASRYSAAVHAVLEKRPAKFS